MCFISKSVYETHRLMIINEYYQLRNGVEIPKIGFGTWQITTNAYESTMLALKHGYRHIDTAEAYGNESEVGRAIKDSKIPREELFITSKLPAEIKGYQEALSHYEASLQRLGFEYLDLYLIHAPWPWHDTKGDYTKQNIETWKAFIKLYQDQKVRSIGVSNFEINHLKAIIDATNFIPFVNQIPVFVGYPQNELRAWCIEQDIFVEAYSPLATGKLIKKPEIIQMADKYQVTPAQLCIRFCLELGTLPLPKSTHEEYIKMNKMVDFRIDRNDLNYLLSLSQ